MSASTRRVYRLSTETWCLSTWRFDPVAAIGHDARAPDVSPEAFSLLDAGADDDLGALARDALARGFDGLSLSGFTPPAAALDAVASHPLRALHLGAADLGAASCASLARCASLAALSLAGSSTGDDALSSLSTLPALRWLSLSSTRTTSEGLSQLTPLHGLEGLELDAGSSPRGHTGPHLSDDAVPALLRFQRLRVLGGYRAALSSPALRALIEGLPSLERVDLRGHSLTARTLEALVRAPAIRYLELPPDTDDDALLALTRCERLEGVNLQSCERVTDRGVAAIARLPTLRALHLYGLEQISPSVLDGLRGSQIRSLGVAWLRLDERHLDLFAAMPSLAHLDVRRTAFEPDGRRRLAALRPALRFA